MINKMTEAVKCGMCLTHTSLTEGDHFVSTQCGHIYHYECVTGWISTHVSGCPTCRKPIENNNLVKLRDIPISFPTNYSPYQFKFALVGTYGVGKTCLLESFSKGIFPTHAQTTIGCDLSFKKVQVAGKSIRLCIRDTGGSERYESMMPIHLRNIHGIIIVYDITRRDSFKSVSKWMDIINNYAPSGTARILIGNKLDLVQEDNEERQVDEEEGRNLALDLGVDFLETSAKEHFNVEATFRTLAATVLQNHWQQGLLNFHEVDLKNDNLENLDALSNVASLARCGC